MYPRDTLRPFARHFELLVLFVSSTSVDLLGYLESRSVAFLVSPMLSTIARGSIYEITDNKVKKMSSYFTFHCFSKYLGHAAGGHFTCHRFHR